MGRSKDTPAEALTLRHYPRPPEFYVPAGPWSLEELLYWLEVGAEEPPAAFHKHRARAVEAVRAAIDQRDLRLKGD